MRRLAQTNRPNQTKMFYPKKSGLQLVHRAAFRELPYDPVKISLRWKATTVTVLHLHHSPWYRFHRK